MRLGSFVIFALVLFFFGCTRMAFSSRKEVVLEVRLSQTGVYCGGARPSQEMMDELQRLKPLANTQFYIKSGEENDPSAPSIVSGITDEEGVAFVSLKPGTFLLVFDDKQDWSLYNSWKTQFQQASEPWGPIDTLCLRQWVRTPEKVFTVQKDSSMVIEVVKTQKCFWNNIPCAEYRGSVPP